MNFNQRADELNEAFDNLMGEIEEHFEPIIHKLIEEDKISEAITVMQSMPHCVAKAFMTDKIRMRKSK